MTMIGLSGIYNEQQYNRYFDIIKNGGANVASNASIFQNSGVKTSSTDKFNTSSQKATTSSTGTQLANAGKNVANTRNSTGWCYAGVAEAVKKATGVQLTGGSAYMAADQLAGSDKFKEIKVSKDQLKNLPAGAIVVWDKGYGNGKYHEHGHISIAAGNGKEYSDHEQKQTENYGTSFRVFVPKDMAGNIDMTQANGGLSGSNGISNKDMIMNLLLASMFDSDSGDSGSFFELAMMMLGISTNGQAGMMNGMTNNTNSDSGSTNGSGNDFYEALAKVESEGKGYDFVDGKSGALGKYQFMPSTLQPYLDSGKYGVSSQEEFLANKNNCQEEIMKAYTEQNWQELKAAGVEKYIDGKNVTKSGVLAAAHLGGTGGAMKYLKTGQNPKDAYGTGVGTYLKKFNGYQV